MHFIDELFNEEEKNNSLNYNQQDFLIGLLENSSLVGKESDQMRDKILSATEEEYFDIRFELELCQLNPILSGRNYTQTDILKHLDNHC